MDHDAAKASPDDAAAIAALQVAGLKAAFKGLLPDDLLEAGTLDFRTRQWRGWLERTHTSTFVTRDGDTLTGFGTLHRAAEADAKGSGTQGSVAEIAALYVLPSHWRRGLGRRLCERCLEEARSRGFSAVVVWELEGNVAAREFCAALGFQAGNLKRAFLENSKGDLYELQYRVTLDGARKSGAQ